MHDEHKIKSQRPILNIVAILDTMQWTIYSCFRFLSLLGVLDDEAMATISVQLQLLQATVDEWRPGRGEVLINSVVHQIDKKIVKSTVDERPDFLTREANRSGRTVLRQIVYLVCGAVVNIDE